jgi:hypothetical protein|uniref:Type II secretion system protein GspG C-terminal domain-containing protein n=1 Tax=candidate division WOR-3 bacterium TaxID=2052148 RepID=A0A7V3VV34_UNCW3
MRAYALIGLIIGLVIVGILVYRAGVTYTHGTRDGQSAVAPPERANILRCQAQIKRIEDAIRLYYIENGRYPERLEELRDILPQETYCPITGRPYLYEPTSGIVICPDHH